jgi:hypothetical protein
MRLILRVFSGWKIPAWLVMTALVAGGLVVFWPSLTTPFFLDDYLHSAMVEGRFPVERSPFALYDFVSDDDRQALFDRGFLPWWTDPRLTLRFFRPLSSAMLFYEHRWIGAWPFAMHLVSFAWWIAVVVVARAFFRRAVPARPAAFATVIFAFAPCHALPLGWLANCEALVALSFGTLGLLALVRWHDARAGVGWALLSFVSFSLALLAGEYALGFAGFVAAFVLRPRTGVSAWRRWSSLLLFAVPASAYLIARRAYGYGAQASGFYQDPLNDMWLYVAHIPWRFTVLTMHGWFSQESTAWIWGDATWPVYTVTAVLTVLTKVALDHVGKALPDDERRTMWTLVLGSFLAFFPVLAVLPSSRLLGVSMLGIAPVVGTVLDVAWFRRTTEARHGMDEYTAIVATLFGFAHLLHAPGRGWHNAREIRAHAVDFANHTEELAKRLRGRESPEVVVVRGLDDVFFFGFALERAGIPDTHWIVLSHAGHVLCRRQDATSIELLVANDTALYPAALGDLYRSELNPLRDGDIFLAGGVRATVEDMDVWGPRRARFEFAGDLDDPRWTWVGESRARGFYDASPPKVGFGAPFDP